MYAVSEMSSTDYGSVKTESFTDISLTDPVSRSSFSNKSRYILSTLALAAIVGGGYHAIGSGSSSATNFAYSRPPADRRDGATYDPAHPKLTSRSLHMAADTHASSEVMGLLTALMEIRAEERFLFGHQNDNYVGQYFKDETGLLGYSDVKNGTGSYPAVFGFDWTDVIENGMNFTEHVKYAFSQGSVVEFDWKPYNPEMGGNANQVKGTPCKKILKYTGKPYDKWIEWLDIIADSLQHFKHNGASIPVIFRFLHENTGGWYWWGTSSYDGTPTCEDTEYIAIWNLTQHYLHEVKGIHNLIWLYAPAKPAQWYNSAFNERYPGDDRIDLVGFDRYDSVNSYKEAMLEDCRVVANWSIYHNKIACIAETGVSDGMQNVTAANASFYYSSFAAAMMEDDMKLCTKVSYALTWENVHPDLYWVPLPEDPTYSGFKTLYDSVWSVFSDDSKWQRDIKQYGYKRSPN